MGQKEIEQRSLTAEQRRFILLRIAEYAPLVEISRQFKKTYGRTLPHRRIQYYRDAPK